MTSSSGTTLRPLGKSQAGQLASTRESNSFQTSGNCWHFSTEMQDAAVTKRQEVPPVTAISNRHDAATITTTILLVMRAGKITANTTRPLLNARNELHAVIHLILNNLRREALLFFPFSSRSHQGTERSRTLPKVTKVESGGSGLGPRLFNHHVTRPPSTRYTAS